MSEEFYRIKENAESIKDPKKARLYIRKVMNQLDVKTKQLMRNPNKETKVWMDVENRYEPSTNREVASDNKKLKNRLKKTLSTLFSDEPKESRYKRDPVTGEDKLQKRQVRSRSSSGGRRVSGGAGMMIQPDVTSKSGRKSLLKKE